MGLLRCEHPQLCTQESKQGLHNILRISSATTRCGRKKTSIQVKRKLRKDDRGHRTYITELLYVILRVREKEANQRTGGGYRKNEYHLETTGKDSSGQSRLMTYFSQRVTVIN